MKGNQITLIVIAISIFVAVASGVFATAWGPERLEFSGKSLPEWLGSDALVVVIGIAISMTITWLVVRPFVRVFFPPQIKDGVTTEARVLKVWDTGKTINDNPEVGLLLEFTSIEGLLLQAETRTPVSRLQAALVQPGITVQIRYDPRKPQRLQILSLHLQEAPSKSVATRLEELNELRDRGLIGDEEYERKREEILSAL